MIRLVTPFWAVRTRLSQIAQYRIHPGVLQLLFVLAYVVLQQEFSTTALVTNIIPLHGEIDSLVKELVWCFRVDFAAYLPHGEPCFRARARCLQAVISKTTARR